MFSKCIDVVGRVSDVVDHEADFMTAAHFYGHLAICSNCRRYFKQFKIVKEAAGVVTPEDLPDDFNRVMDFVMREVEKRGDKNV